MAVLRKIADVLAVVFHPVFLLFFWLTLIYDKGGSWRGEIMVVALALTVVVPVAATWIFTRDLFNQPREKRFFPLLGALVSYGTFAALAYYRWQEQDLAWIAGSIALCLVLVFLLNFLMKPSLHAAGFGFLFYYMMVVLGMVIRMNAIFTTQLLLLMAVPPVIMSIILWQRYVCRSHNFIELSVGFLLGFVSAGLGNYLRFGSLI